MEYERYGSRRNIGELQVDGERSSRKKLILVLKYQTGYGYCRESRPSRVGWPMRTCDHVSLCIFWSERPSQTFGANLERLALELQLRGTFSFRVTSFPPVLSWYPPVTQTSFRVSSIIKNQSVPSVHSVSISPSFQRLWHVRFPTLAIRVPVSSTSSFFLEQSHGALRANSRLRLWRFLRLFRDNNLTSDTVLPLVQAGAIRPIPDTCSGFPMNFEIR